MHLFCSLPPFWMIIHSLPHMISLVVVIRYHAFCSISLCMSTYPHLISSPTPCVIFHLIDLWLGSIVLNFLTYIHTHIPLTLALILSSYMSWSYCYIHISKTTLIFFPCTFRLAEMHLRVSVAITDWFWMTIYVNQRLRPFLVYLSATSIGRFWMCICITVVTIDRFEWIYVCLGAIDWHALAWNVYTPMWMSID